MEPMLPTWLDRITDMAPMPLLARAALERALDPQPLDRLFDDHAERQYTRRLLLSSLVDLMALVVCRSQPSVRQAYAQLAGGLGASLTAVYDKLARLEPGLSQALVRHTAGRLRPVIDLLRPATPAWFPGYEVRILDGNVLKASHHRLQALRPTRASALAGLSVVVLDPERGLAVDVFPCEDGHAQERSLLAGVLETVQPGQLWIGDRNFCTAGFVGGIIARPSGFLLRQHAATVQVAELEPLREAGPTATGAVWEQRVRLTNVAGAPVVRRVVVRLAKPTRDGETELRLLTNLPAAVADAARVAETYRARWGIEALFQRLTVVLNAEVRPLGYPRAALFGFAVALVASNAFATVTAALEAAHPTEPVRAEVSYYQLGLELTQAKLLLDAVPAAEWDGLMARSDASFAGWLSGVAQGVPWERYRKTRRGPKKPRPERPRCPRYRHVSTKKLLDQRKSKTP
jgi:hypothetical protein